MPKRRTAAATTEATEPTPAREAAIAAEEKAAELAKHEPARPAFASDPFPGISVSLSDHQGGPSMHLQRSQQYRQMQIRIEGGQLADHHQARLRQAGWRDRTEEEGIWTKQIDRDARWQSVQQMEREFREIANAIRKEKGLAPALEGMAVA
jgi:hypothetical protein